MSGTAGRDIHGNDSLKIISRQTDRQTDGHTDKRPQGSTGLRVKIPSTPRGVADSRDCQVRRDKGHVRRAKGQTRTVLGSGVVQEGGAQLHAEGGAMQPAPALCVTCGPQTTAALRPSMFVVWQKENS